MAWCTKVTNQKKIAWSNLYKIAPEDANPNGYERIRQLPLSSDLIKKEIEEINPKYCIVITGSQWWQHFHELINPQVIESDGLPSEIVNYERYNQTDIIVTNRPRFGNSDLFAQQILKLIKK
jgi:hypothetical protein